MRIFEAGPRNWLPSGKRAEAPLDRSLTAVAPVRLPVRKIVYLVTEDWYFWSHRLPVARAMRDAGVKVVVASRIREHGDRIAAEGFEVRPLPWRRRGDGIAGGLRALLAITRVYRDERPDLVHHIALKAIVFGAVAALVARVPRQVNLVAGLGFVFVEPSLRARVQRLAVMLSLRYFAGRRNSRIIVQNEEDRRALVRWKVFTAAQVDLVAGSGVDLARFRPLRQPQAPPFVGAMVCRMLHYKGISVAVRAAKLLHRLGIPFRLRLVGPTDPDNETSHTEREIAEWCRDGAIEWLGHVDDIPSMWADAHICIFPTRYREGVPKALLEAAACARPIIASNMPGCRDVIEDGVSGYLVPEDDAKAVARSIIRLCADSALRERMGAAARLRAEQLFAEELIVAQTLEVYRKATRPSQA